MKGVIFNVVEEVVTEQLGADVWDALLDAAGVDGAYTALGNYADEELVAIVGAASDALGQPTSDVLRMIGRHAYGRLAGRYPHLVEGLGGSRAVLAHLHSVIHPQVLAIYPDAVVPEFEFHDGGDELLLEYRSERGLCHLAEGLALGVIDAYGERAEVHQPRCRHSGDDRCLLVVRYVANG
jgi:hypothetical protein